MARIMINDEIEPEPSLIEEDVQIAVERSGLPDAHVIDQGDGCFTIDLYSDRDVPADAIDSLQLWLPPDGGYNIEGADNMPPRGWAYADREVRY